MKAYVKELLTHIVKDSETMNTKIYLHHPHEVADCLGDLKYEAQEHFVVLCLNAANRLIAHSTVTVGTINQALVHPREVFRTALAFNTASIVVAHNHPSGNSEPSEEDIKITKQLKEAGKVLGIPLMDHVIIAQSEGYVSLAERGLV